MFRVIELKARNKQEALLALDVLRERILNQYVDTEWVPGVTQIEEWVEVTEK